MWLGGLIEGIIYTPKDKLIPSGVFSDIPFHDESVEGEDTRNQITE